MAKQPTHDTLAVAPARRGPRKAADPQELVSEQMPRYISQRLRRLNQLANDAKDTGGFKLVALRWVDGDLTIVPVDLNKCIADLLTLQPS